MFCKCSDSPANGVGDSGIFMGDSRILFQYYSLTLRVSCANFLLKFSCGEQYDTNNKTTNIKTTPIWTL